MPVITLDTVNASDEVIAAVKDCDSVTARTDGVKTAEEE
jgi:hypothetical protein